MDILRPTSCPRRRFRHLGDAITAAIANKTSFADAIATVQKQTVADLQAKGLKVATG